MTATMPQASPKARRCGPKRITGERGIIDSLSVRHPFFASTRPLVFAHRGGSALAPENTMEAFDNGLAHGADGLELDVHLSRDGAVVVHHDRTLDRTTTLRGPIADRTAEEL